ncbi:MAG: tripartite tricarboxylate transporter substrate binding protein [Burkholderiales bacterium]|nr:tripartite tricarboxylate transporter substrate binding protein [Burkholderiales bacterium]
MKAGTAAGTVLALIGAVCVPPAAAQSFPAKPIQIIVPFSPGGVVDLLARVLGAQITESTGQPVIVTDRPGASSIIGMDACARAAPDGYTVCITVPDSLSYNPHLFSKLPYDAENDFAPVTNLGFTNNLLVANSKAPFNSYKEMVAYARANPRALNWGTWGVGSLPDVYLRWVSRLAGIDITAVPYKGAGIAAFRAVYAGEVDITYMGVGTAMPQIKGGIIKPLVTLGERRSRFMPDLPALAEEGGDPSLPSYFGLFAPGRTPRPVLERLNQEFVKAARTPLGQKFYQERTMEAVLNSVADFARFVVADRANAGRVLRSLGVQPTAAPSS